MKVSMFAYVISIVLVSSGSAVAAEKPGAGAYGFDWLQPATAQCVAIDAEKLKQLKPCKLDKSAGFKGASKVLICPMLDTLRSEYVVLGSKRICEDQLKALKNNGS